MATELQLAAFAYNAYHPSPDNEIRPSGWDRDDDLSRENRGGGSDGSVFYNGTEVVIAFRGSDLSDEFPYIEDPEDWTEANFPATFGSWAERIQCR